MPKDNHIGISRSSIFFALVMFGITLLPMAYGQRSGSAGQNSSGVERGQGPASDWPNEKPGDRHLISPADLPKPGATESATNRSRVVPRPGNAAPQAPAG